MNGNFSQQTESMILSDGGVRVGYAVEEEVDVNLDGREHKEFQQVARRGRRRAFAIRHHEMEGKGDVDGGVREELEHVMQQVGGLGTDGGIASLQQDGDDGSVCQPLHIGASMDSKGGTSLDDCEGRSIHTGPQVGVRMGSGGHALTVDAKMMAMMSRSSKRTGRSATPSLKIQPKRRRQQKSQQTTTRRQRRSHGLGERLLATQLDPTAVQNSSPMQEFISAVPAPSQIAPSRTRMRAPATLTQLADSLEERLQVLASTRTGSSVSTLKLRIKSVHTEYGKMMCRCSCDAPMGLLRDHFVVAVMRYMTDLDDLVSSNQGASMIDDQDNTTIGGHEIIVNKPWLILEDPNRSGTVLYCLGEVAYRRLHES